MPTHTTNDGTQYPAHRIKPDPAPEGEDRRLRRRARLLGILGARKHGNGAMTGTAGEAVFPAA